MPSLELLKNIVKHHIYSLINLFGRLGSRLSEKKMKRKIQVLIRFPGSCLDSFLMVWLLGRSLYSRMSMLSLRKLLVFLENCILSLWQRKRREKLLEKIWELLSLMIIVICHQILIIRLLKLRLNQVILCKVLLDVQFSSPFIVKSLRDLIKHLINCSLSNNQRKSKFRVNQKKVLSLLWIIMKKLQWIMLNNNQILSCSLRILILRLIEDNLRDWIHRVKKILVEC